MRRFGITIIGVLLSVTMIFAQDCPTMEQAAVGESRVWCADMTSGEACFGNSIVSAEFTSFAADNLVFSSPGDKVELTEIASLSTSVDENRYGVTLLHTTGYTSDSWEAFDVALTLLGDATVTNTAQENVTVNTTTTTITASEGANVRTGTSTEFRVLTSLFAGDIVKITGKLADNAWYRVQLQDGRTGWIASSAITDNLGQLPVVDMDSPQPDLLYAPYTSFSLQTASRDNRCGQAWESGLLVQTDPDTTIRFIVNEQNLLITGTVFLQAVEENSFDIFVIEGFAQMGENDIVEGYQATISTQADDSGNFPPPSISAYDFSRMAYLPTEMLPRYVYIGIELSTIITPAPTIDRSPIIDTLVTEPCVLTTGDTGANLRGGPGREFPLRGVLAYRETAHPIGRTIGSDSGVWWELEQNVWINSAVVVTGGDCAAVPQSQRIPNPPPTATPEN